MYQETIEKIQREDGYDRIDPRHIEAWMRLEWGTLDGRPLSDFRRYVREVFDAHQCGAVSESQSESLARSYGL